MQRETTFASEAGHSAYPRLRRWSVRFIVLTGSVALALSLFAGTATAQPPSGSAFPAGAADDGMTEFDWQIMQSWLAQKLGAGFQRFLNGDGGGTGFEGDDTAAQFVADGPPPCPFCGATYPDTDQGWTDRAKHMLNVEWDKILDAVEEGRKNGLGTGSANGLANDLTINPASFDVDSIAVDWPTVLANPELAPGLVRFYGYVVQFLLGLPRAAVI